MDLSRLHVGGLVLLLVVPLAVAVAVLHDPQTTSLDDVAQIEMRVRDVGGGHPPLLGVAGRVEGFGDEGNHPGPLAFYALWPVYALLGGSGWALQAAAAALTAAGSALAVWTAQRRGGLPFALAATGVLALVLRAYGPDVLASAWNPYTALVWWGVFLLAVWSVLADDLALLPVVAAAGMACVQMHLSYVVPVIGLWLLTTAAVVARWRRERGDPRRRLTLLRWLVAATLLGTLLSAPPLAEELANRPGNIAVLYEGFREPVADQAPFGQALDDWLQRLDPTALVRRDTGANADGLDVDLHLGRRVPGLLLLAAWAAAAVVAHRRRDRPLVRLHLTLAAAEALTLLATSRIYGPLWPYLVMSAWTTGALVLLATLWTFVSAPPGDDDPPGRLGPLRAPHPTLAVLGGATAVAALAFLHAAVTVDPPTSGLATGIHTVAAETDDHLADDPLGCGADCRYLVRSSDMTHIVSPMYSLLLELEKRGYDVGLDPPMENAVEAHRVMDLGDADAVLDLTVGDDLIEATRERAGTEELAWVDPGGAGEPPLAVFLVRPEEGPTGGG